MLFAEVRHLDLSHDTAKVQIFFLTVFNLKFYVTYGRLAWLYYATPAGFAAAL
jgi:hypothetical protein